MDEQFTADEADRLLRLAFPTGATVDTYGGGSFVALRFGVGDAPGEDGCVELWFERDPGDTLQRATRDDLVAAGRTGRMELETAVIRRPEPRDLTLLANPWQDFLGGQSSSDDAWTARMRLHQTWWRAFRLRRPAGPGPNKGSKVLRGNMLDDDGATAGLNFLSDDARRSYEERVGLTKEGVSEWRTSRNLLASQPLAFNLFGHLRHNLDLATALFADLLGSDEVETVTEVEIERLSDALGDHTAFDAFATYRRPDGSTGCIAIETKLTEPFSQQSYDWTKYLGHGAFARSIWATDEAEQLGDKRWSQLFRNHLLGAAETAARRLGPVTLLVVHHPLDPKCAGNVAGYRRLLVVPDAVRAVDLRAIADILERHVTSSADRSWLGDFRDRYLNLELSDDLLGLRGDG
jgi:hypothetical protein